ncbi:MAG: NAD(P)/FAD-dependent oxidoreductase [Gammaproteobacteria bacterium]|nr:NAD(P)/FAD-dependent oxidoreductase [Gammaproteobacteria bacterium]NNC98354.1 NAD(P)/FAD-dependent oxidoreductase [Gammaproteobacteria bacterium]NNM13741.1 NAD(P)/FAD-dependent oxidoreductase [Gammaproteobacteria bacterium]
MSVNNPNHYDVIVIGAGAAGLMCAITAGQRGRRVLIIDHANKVGKKILMSGGGRCNFTNLHTSDKNFLSANAHFCKSALSRYTQYDFIELVEKHQIEYQEKKHGQLFCVNKAKDIVRLLLDECESAAVRVETSMSVNKINYKNEMYSLATSQYSVSCDSLVIATGGLSIPRMGATGFGYQVAAQFGLRVNDTSAALVPFVLTESLQQQFEHLSGISAPAQVSCNDMSFTEDMLFTHRGLSGPVMLQISSYWKPGDTLSINLLPKMDLQEKLQTLRSNGKIQRVKNFLMEHLSKQLVESLSSLYLKDLADKRIADLANVDIDTLTKYLQEWEIKPSSTEGYRTAEVTLGGVDTDDVSSKTFECKSQQGLYFIGEVLDVTGWLGGFNFQWAWASGYAAGMYV